VICLGDLFILNGVKGDYIATAYVGYERMTVEINAKVNTTTTE
jgi:hypothetical protein